MNIVSEWSHLTWPGRVAMAWYPLRRLFVRDASPEERCFMGAPVGPHVHCPRRAVDGSLWCVRHGGDT